MEWVTLTKPATLLSLFWALRQAQDSPLPTTGPRILGSRGSRRQQTLITFPLKKCPSVAFRHKHERTWKGSGWGLVLNNKQQPNKSSRSVEAIQASQRSVRWDVIIIPLSWDTGGAEGPGTQTSAMQPCCTRGNWAWVTACLQLHIRPGWASPTMTLLWAPYALARPKLFGV